MRLESRRLESTSLLSRLDSAIVHTPSTISARLLRESERDLSLCGISGLKEDGGGYRSFQDAGVRVVGDDE